MLKNKTILITILGCVVSIILTILIEFIIGKIYPIDIDVTNKQQYALIAGNLPILYFVILLVSFAFVAFIGGITASLISGRTNIIFAFYVGIVLTVAGYINTTNIPHPDWFFVLNVMEYIPFACLGFFIVRKKQ